MAKKQNTFLWTVGERGSLPYPRPSSAMHESLPRDSTPVAPLYLLTALAALYRPVLDYAGWLYLKPKAAITLKELG
jgi:hypothetical protein